ncbi:hypothetical protein DY000_02013442 [Brassica cretica]|uniref:Uncharacterized protein n=1 Tax=Brassica cretica TaxID=69181 RepID=A0ABQ7D8Q4_BRACR|nr:hypothetical protein DY000_02013442 [Brassica cretica]
MSEKINSRAFFGFEQIVLGNVFKFTEKETKTELNICLSRKQVEDSISRSSHGVEAIVRELREKAMVLASKDMVESTKAYREAAGVFDYVCKIGHTDWSYIEKCPELTSPVCSSLKLICLAEGHVSFLILLTVGCD